MEVSIGVIRDKQGIYSGLLQSQLAKRQLAVCYNREGKLFVKLSVVRAIIKDGDGTRVILMSADDPPDRTEILLDNIQSIYLISEFLPPL